MVAPLTEEGVSPQTVSKLARDLDRVVKEFHEAPLKDEWSYLFLEGVSLRGRRREWTAAGANAGGLWSAGRRKSAAPGVSAQFRRKPGSVGRIVARPLPARVGRKATVIDCHGWVCGAIQTVYPRVRHQRCWVHKMRNILEKVRKRDYDAVKVDAQAIYLGNSEAEARACFRRFRASWQEQYPTVVRQFERDLPELLSFFHFPRHLWRKLRTTIVIEVAAATFVEVRRRTRPMVCFVNVQSVDRIIYSIFHRFNLDWQNRTLQVFTRAA